MERLAVNGGRPVRKTPFPFYNTIGKEEEKAVSKVLKTGVLSKFLGSWDKLFYGGPQVRALEKEWAEYFNARHAIAVNSCTSGLYCAIGACGIGPGDEVIVSPYTMSATATSILIFNGVPVFADVEEDYFCLDPESVRKRITARTKAIMVVDIFGQPYDADKINRIAEEKNLFVIEDCAQAPFARYKGKWAGTLGDIGVYSLNYHKHIHTGEGGIVVTDNDKLAEKIRLIRNHAEAVVRGKGVKDLVNMVGFNFRMTEIEAAIGRCQLKKLKALSQARMKNAGYIAARLGRLPGIVPAPVRKGCTHVYYTQCFKYDRRIAGVNRDKFIEAVRAELAPTASRESEGARVSAGYVLPLYLEPIYQKQVAYGKKGCPFRCPMYKGRANYSKGLCPVSERLHYQELFQHGLMHASMKKRDLDDLIEAFEKVYRLQRKR